MAVSEMTESLQRVGEQPLELSVEEQNLLSVAYGSTAGCRRAAWCIITSVEQKKNIEADDAKHSPKISSRDRILQCAVEQSLDVPVHEKAEQLVEATKIVPQDRILQQTESSGLWSILPLILQFRRMWRNRQSSSRLSLRTGFNCVSEDRSLKTLLPRASANCL